MSKVDQDLVAFYDSRRTPKEQSEYEPELYILEHLLAYSAGLIGGYRDMFRSCQGYSSVGLVVLRPDYLVI